MKKLSDWMKNKVRSILPQATVSLIQEYRADIWRRRFKDLSTREVFSEIYKQALWGKSNHEEDRFYSGLGSREPDIVQPYISAVKEYLEKLQTKPNVVDLGCGDFLIGSQIRPLCANYVACDIVPELIEFNKNRYHALDIDFRVLDIVEDDLPDGRIVFLRQVLQHLSNDQISRILPKIRDKFEVLIFSDHRATSSAFEANRDIAAGVRTRLHHNSGLELSMTPFNLEFRREYRICEVEDEGGLIVTTVYELF